MTAHLIRAHDQFVIVAEGDEVFNVGLAQALSGGIAGVDEDQRPAENPFALGFLDRASQLVDIKGPAVIFIQVVRDKLPAIQRNLRTIRYMKYCTGVRIFLFHVTYMV